MSNQNQFEIELIESLKQLIYSEWFRYDHRLCKTAFTRTRVLTFPILILLMVNLRKSSLLREIGLFFQTLTNSAILNFAITKAAFSKARHRISHLAFVTLNYHLTDFFYQRGPLVRWRGFLLLAIDGSTARLPEIPDITAFFGQLKSSTSQRTMARLSHLYDVLNKVILDAAITPYSTSEATLAIQHLESRPLPQRSIILFDRGYLSFKLATQIQRAGNFFVMRAKTSNLLSRRLVDQGLSDAYFSWETSSSNKSKLRKEGLPTDPIPLRVISVTLINGEVEYLYTNLLDRKAFPYEDFLWLYHQRWSIEESYKVMKSRLEIENFTGKSVLSFQQDFFAKIFTGNLTAILQAPLQPKLDEINSDRVHNYKFNFTTALSTMKGAVVLLLNTFDPLPLLHDLQDCWFKALEPIRPDRVFPRKNKGKNQPKIQGFYGTYKRAL